MTAWGIRSLAVTALACSCLDSAAALSQLRVPAAARIPASVPQALVDCQRGTCDGDGSRRSVLRLSGGAGRADRVVSFFRQGATRRERWLGLWLLLWNCFPAFDAAMFTLRGDEATLKSMFGVLLLNALGSFRAMYEGIKDHTVAPPWRPGYAWAMTGPPIVILAYFAFVF